MQAWHAAFHSPFSLSDPTLIRSALRGLTSDGNWSCTVSSASNSIEIRLISLSHCLRSGGIESNLRVALQLVLLRSPVLSLSRDLYPVQSWHLFRTASIHQPTAPSMLQSQVAKLFEKASTTISNIKICLSPRSYHAIWNRYSLT